MTNSQSIYDRIRVASEQSQRCLHILSIDFVVARFDVDYDEFPLVPILDLGSNLLLINLLAAGDDLLRREFALSHRGTPARFISLSRERLPITPLASSPAAA